jgi:hypothetical protein
VGYYFQQRRATLLAAAIKSRIGSEKLESYSIGIVGGGVSGLTFLLTIMNEGAKEVCLYESGTELIARGVRSKHRLLHPNYNRWPLLGSMDVFTSLPVLNWHAASADSVISLMQNEISAKFADRVTDHVRFNHKVKRILQRSDALAKPLQVEFVTSGITKTQDHNLIVIAAGFGDEGAAAWGLNDYWTEDAINFDENTHQRQCTVYGAGDGALIDIIRACAKSPSEAWRMPLELIAHLRAPEATTIQKDSLRQKNIHLRLPAFTAIERKIQSHEENIRSMAWSISRNDPAVTDQYAQEEQDFYFGLIKELEKNRQGILQKLNVFLKPVAASPNLRPVLVGTKINGFEPTSAPINKLLLALLLHTGRVRFEQREKLISEAELTAWSIAPATERTKAIVVCRFGATKNFPLAGLASVRPPLGVVVEIEGSGPVTETEAEANLIDALSGITGGEYVYFNSMPDPIVRARNGLDQEGATWDTRSDNSRILQSFARQHLDAEVLLSPRASSDGPKWVLRTSLNDDEIRERLIRVGGIDGNFLGAPIVISRAFDAKIGQF